MENRCPICHKIVIKSAADAQQAKVFPFCSDRCKLIDLGSWFDGRYTIISRTESQQEQSPPENSAKGVS